MGTKLIRILALGFLTMWGLPKCVMTRIEPFQLGVKRSLTGGVVERDYDFGYHLAVPGLHTFHRIPSRLQYLHFNENTDVGALEVRTRENNIIFVDTTVVWRVKRGEAWRIIQEGFEDSYPQKVQSTSTGVLREGLASLTNTDITQPEKRRATAMTILAELNQALAQYHVEAIHVVIRGIRFRPEYEKKLQDKQYYIVQGKLDEALKNKSMAVQQTETEEKVIEKDIKLKTEEWNARIEQLKTQYEIAIAEIEAQALQYDRKKRSEADAEYAKLTAEGDLAEARAEALGQRLKSQALASRAGQTYSAIKAAENFQLGAVQLNSNDPEFLMRFGSMRAWRRFFTGD